MNLLYNIPMGTPSEFNTVIEIPKESNHKYEYNPELETFVLDRILLPAMQYPGNYGFIPQTIAMDDDALDVLVVNAGSIELGAVTKCYPIGGIDMYDNDKRDVKIICMPTFHHRKEKFKTIADFDPYFIEQVHHFFSHYKDLEDKKVELKGWLTAEECQEVILESCERFWTYTQSIQNSIMEAFGHHKDGGNLDELPPMDFTTGDPVPEDTPTAEDPTPPFTSGSGWTLDDIFGNDGIDPDDLGKN